MTRGNVRAVRLPPAFGRCVRPSLTLILLGHKCPAVDFGAPIATAVPYVRNGKSCGHKCPLPVRKAPGLLVWGKISAKDLKLLSRQLFRHFTNLCFIQLH